MERGSSHTHTTDGFTVICSPIMLELSLAALQPGLHTFHFDPSPETVDLDPAEFDDIEVDVHLDLQERQALVNLQTAATARLICDRTLVPFEQEIEGSHTLLFTASAAPENDNALDDVRPLSPDDLSLDLTEAVRDTLVLALPLRRIAPEAENLDLQTEFGDPADEDDIDPRWEALRNLGSDPSAED